MKMNPKTKKSLGTMIWLLGVVIAVCIAVF